MKGRELPMLMDIKCSMVPSIKVNLTFDDGRKKDPTLGVGDLIDLLYNSNGLRKHIIGKIIQINTPGHDPKGWSFIVDGSDDFESEIARLSPMSILDVDVIRKNGSCRHVATPVDDTGCYAIRVNRGVLQYTKDGKRWHNIKINDIDVIPGREDVIIDENNRPEPAGEGFGPGSDDDTIFDENS